MIILMKVKESRIYLHKQQLVQNIFVMVQKCVIATGTPIANRPIDLFAQYFVMDNGFNFWFQFSCI